MAIANGKYKGASLSLTINSVEYNMDLTSANIVSEDADSGATTFADVAAGGGKDWFLDVAAVSDYGTGSLWNYIWSNAGTTGVAFMLKPYGNSAASAAKPHFSGTLVVPGKPNIGGTADEVFTFETRFELEGEPTMVTV